MKRNFTLEFNGQADDLESFIILVEQAVSEIKKRQMEGSDIDSPSPFSISVSMRKNEQEILRRSGSEPQNTTRHSPPMTQDEQLIAEYLVDANNLFVSLPNTGSDDLRDWNSAIHRLQDLMGARVLRILYPQWYKTPKI